MIINNSNKLGIFFFFDKDGIVDDYIVYLLDDLKKNIKDLLIVCNGKLNESGRKKFERFSDKIIVRGNEGFDVFAYKAGIEYIGYENLKQYDELIMLNSTIMGPVYPFSEMFSTMDKRDLDFWGITKYHKNETDPFNRIKYGYLPEHIQSHFIAVRKSVLADDRFHKYWQNMRQIDNYLDAVCHHEAIFTKTFEDFGYSWDTYINTDDLVGVTNYPILIRSVELVQNRRCPIFKRRSFFHDYSDYLDNGLGESAFELLEFLKGSKLYDESLIWQNILRTENMYDIKNACQSNFILPYNISKESKSVKRVALIFHIYFQDLIEECFEYSKSMPSYADIYITTDTASKKALIEKVFEKLECNRLVVEVIENRGRDVSSLLVFGKDVVFNYDYVCFAHDKKSKMLIPNSVGLSFSYKCLENVLGSRELVENIIDTFDNNPNLGLLTPPPPNHAQYYLILGEEWTENYKLVEEFLEKHNFKVKISEDKPPISPLGTIFWFRTDALRPLFDIRYQYEDFPKEPFHKDGTLLHVIERAYGLVTQSQGYYPAYMMSDRYAKIEVTNLAFMIREFNNSLFKLTPIRDRKALINQICFSFLQSSEQQAHINHLYAQLGIKSSVKRIIKRIIFKIYKFIKR